MRILILSYFCPPEFSAAATRVFDNAKRFAARGHDVTILTGVPNYPRGRVFDGYRYRLVQEERRDGVRIVRVASWIASNRTTAGRLEGYLSLTASQIVMHRFASPADVVVGSSPPLFTAFAGLAVARMLGKPFVFEVADLWPENMLAVGAVRQGVGIRAMAGLERLLLRRAARVITVTPGFREYYVRKGVPADKLEVVTNGVDLVRFRPAERPAALARELGVEGKFVAAYIGTVGINHGLATVLDAAERLKAETDVAFLVVGDGAERGQLEADARRRGLGNVRFLGERPRDEMPAYHALADALLVLLKDSPYFHLVIPSKIFVAMASGRPIVLGVDGEARRIVEQAGAGVFVTPEDPGGVAQALLQLRARGPAELAAMGRAGRAYAERHYDRDGTAARYLGFLEEIAGRPVPGRGA